jgi:hypothetical protein
VQSSFPRVTEIDINYYFERVLRICAKMFRKKFKEGKTNLIIAVDINLKDGDEVGSNYEKDR